MAGRKTNVMRSLDAAGVPYAPYEYAYDEEASDAVSAAAKLGAPPEQVFKTLVCHGDRGAVCVFCIPANAELDLKKAARASGTRSVEMARAADLPELTGYVRGGCSPLGMKHRYPVFIEESAVLFDRIYVNAGARGMQLLIAPAVLAALSDAHMADLV